MCVNVATWLCLLSQALGSLSSIPPLSVVKPSKPRCYTEGPTEEGKDIVLRCTSHEGTNPLKYSWEKTSDNKLLPATSVMGKGPSYKPSRTSFPVPHAQAPLLSYCCLFIAVFITLQTLWQEPLT